MSNEITVKFALPEKTCNWHIYLIDHFCFAKDSDTSIAILEKISLIHRAYVICGEGYISLRHFLRVKKSATKEITNLLTEFMETKGERNG